MLVNTGDRALPSHNRLLTTIAYRLKGKTTYALEGSIFNAGTVIQWLRDNAKMITSAAESERLAAELDHAGGTGRVYFVPAFTGLGAPHWDASARGAILGLTCDSSIGHIVRAGLESVCYQTHNLLTALRQDGIASPPALRVDGGAWLGQAYPRPPRDLINDRPSRAAAAEAPLDGAQERHHFDNPTNHSRGAFYHGEEA